MPSFSVENQNYYYYLDHYIANVEFTAGELWCKCAKYSVVIWFLFSLCLSVYFGSIYLYIYENSIYYEYQIYWIPVIIYCLSSSLWLFLIMFMLRSIHRSDDTLHFIMFRHRVKSTAEPGQITAGSIRTKCGVFLIALTVFIIIPFILTEYYTSDYIVDLDSEIQSRYFDSTWQWFPLLAFVVIPGILPIICFSIWYCVYSLCPHKQRKVANHHENANAYTNGAKTSHQSASLEMTLSAKHGSKQTDTTYLVPSTFSRAETDEMSERLLTDEAPDAIIDRQAKPLRQSVIFLTLWLAMVLWYYLEVRIWSSRIIQHYHDQDNNLLVYYLQFLLIYIVLKWMLKYYGNVMDRIRALRNNNQHYLSFQLLLEWFLSVLYWSWFRWFIAFKMNHHSSLNFQTQFIFIFALHALTEVIQTNLKMTKKYYSCSSAAIKLFFQHRMDNNCNFRIYSFIKDSSSKQEWIHRLSIDITVRFFASTVTAIVMMGVLMIINSTYYNQWFTDAEVLDQDVSYYQEAFAWSMVSVTLDFVYYLVVFFYLYASRDIVIFEPMVNFIACMSTRHSIILFLIYSVPLSFLLFL